MKTVNRWLGIFVALAVLTVSVDWWLSPADPEVYEVTDYSKKRQNTPEHRTLFGGPFFAATGHILGEHGEAVIAVATVWLVFVTGFLAFYTYQLWSETGQLVKDSGKTSKRELKAYVFVTKVELESELTEGKTMRADVIIRNVGQTPAHDVRIDGDITIADFPLKTGVLRELDFSTTPDFSRQVLGPGCEREKQQITKPLTGAQVEGLESNKMAVYLYGKILYEDEFGKNRWTTYRYFWNASIKAMRNRRLAADSDGNKADRDEEA